jgi:hypothetical protein
MLTISPSLCRCSAAEQDLQSETNSAPYSSLHSGLSAALLLAWLPLFVVVAIILSIMLHQAGVIIPAVVLSRITPSCLLCLPPLVVVRLPVLFKTLVFGQLWVLPSQNGMIFFNLLWLFIFFIRLVLLFAQRHDSANGAPFIISVFLLIFNILYFKFIFSTLSPQLGFVLYPLVLE